MRRRAHIGFVVAALAVATGMAATLLSRRAEAAVSVARKTRAHEQWVRTADIEFYTRRAAEDPMSAEDRAMVAGMLLQRAREGGGRADYALAQMYASASLALRTSHNGKARLALASALLAQHHFPEARREAQRLVTEAPSEPRYRALLAELLVEMGDYDEAGVQFDSLGGDLMTLAVAPRYARYLEFRGDTRKALRTLENALAAARRERALPGEQVAWFALRLADAQLRSGDGQGAVRTLRAALRGAPDDARLWALEARRRATRGEWRSVLDAIELAGGAPDLQTMALSGDAWAALGDTARAREAWNATEVSALENPEPYNRQWTLFRLEHGMHLDSTRALLEAEIQGRNDVFGWGQLAFARLLTGDREAAEQAIQEALAIGTPDAWLWYVAGRIAEANTRSDDARNRYQRALALNAQFHHRYAADARSRLSAMQ